MIIEEGWQILACALNTHWVPLTSVLSIQSKRIVPTVFVGIESKLKFQISISANSNSVN